MKTIRLIILCTGLFVHACAHDSSTAAPAAVMPAVTTDSITRGDYTLVFINQSPTFDLQLKERMINTFFTVYPVLANAYNPNTLKKVTFVIDPSYTGVAATSGGRVVYNPEWFRQHPGDIDVVTHEVMHVVQSYPGGAGPGWLTEGIADYVRYRYGVDNDGAGWSLTAFNPSQRYDNSYRITARFLVWLEKNFSDKLVKILDDHMRRKTYSPGIWQSQTGKSLDDLWQDYASRPAL
ncbi:secretory protein [Chitinophaga oryzae]|uniref:Secretory protein n=1 Tax=Chitinophaga oryzae TaxID=2725414 RepID=A0AAE6ZIW1_9BACT|nr:basic secretory protein-like protein [Chitinophaga oryzae]QJB32977.1 secretory protein [Chitinophaga oryzae]QJB39443.1 secretory protein [Chitinophaga oryzae]